MNIYGINPVIEALRAHPRKISRIVISRGKARPRLQEIIDLARRQGVPVRFEPVEALSRKAATTGHQDVVAELSEVAILSLEEIIDRAPERLLLVDGVEDPRNLGALLRTAEAAGVAAVLLPERHTSAITPLVVKASAGAALHLPTGRVANVVRALQVLKQAGLWVVGLDMRGKDEPEQIDRSLRLLVVVGGEHRGLRRLVREQCDFLVALPMKGQVSSLNLSVAAGILLYRLL